MRRRPLLVAVLAIGLPLLTLLALLAVRASRPSARALAASLSLAEAMGGETAGYARATAPREFAFPADHGPHPGFRTEWWYFTGNLAGPAGEPYGFQLTFFRAALAPPQPPAADAPRSPWRADDLYMAHLAVGDARAGRFRHAERFARGALGLAGAQAGPFRVWLESWSATAADGQSAADGDADFPLRLAAAAGEGEARLALDLRLERGKRAVAQGDRGLSRKGPEPGNASYYYSLTRMPAEGRLTVGRREVAVRGLAWMDREWSTSALGAEVVGWDWFALQLADGRDLMLYRLRRADGASEPWSAGNLVDAAGGSTPLGAETFRLTPLATWRSPRGGSYPVRWRVEVPGEGLDLEVVARIDDQELAAAVRYWEGAVSVRGTARGAAIEGSGFLEMTGYAAPSASRRGRPAGRTLLPAPGPPG